MKLTEVLIAVLIFLIAATVFSASLVSVNRSICKTESVLKNAVSLLETDALLRKKIKSFDIPYWKNLDMEFESCKENILLFCTEKQTEIIGISKVYDKNHKAEGIEIEWKFDGKNYTCREFIKQRIIF